MLVIRRIEHYSGSWSLKYKIIGLVNPLGPSELENSKAAYNNGSNNKRKTNFN
jgi:hypothetical protein